MADFCLVGRRTLEDMESGVFRNHFLLGADWKLCCRQLHIDRGTFFHHVYNIENRLGRVFAELTPYPLYPVAEYFSGVTRYDVQRAEVTSLVRRSNSPELPSLRLTA
jgi:hypothetical protein